MSMHAASSRLRPFRRHLVLLCCFLVGAACGLVTSPDEQLERARQDMEQGKFAAAAVQAQVVLKDDPGNREAARILARGLLDSAQSGLAGNVLEQAAALEPRPDWVDEMRAELAVQLGQFPTLQQRILTGELKLSPDAASLYRAHALKAMGRSAEAIQLYSSIATSELREAAAIGLGEAYAARGQTARAIFEMKRATAQMPDSPAVWLALGRLQLADGAGNQAAESLNRAMQLHPERMPTYQAIALFTLMGNESLTRGDIKQAEDVAQRMIAVMPQGLYGKLLDARVMLAKGDTQGATNALQKLLSKSPEFHDAELPLVAALVAQGSLEQAMSRANALLAGSSEDLQLKLLVTSIDAAIKTEPDTVHRHLAMASALVAANEPAPARAAVASALRLDSGSRDALAASVQIEQRSGRLEQALASATELARVTPDSPVALTMLAEVQLAMKQFRDADATYASIWRLQPSAAAAMGMHVARMQGKFGDAAAPLQQWLGTHPDDMPLRFALAEALKVSQEHTKARAEYERILRSEPGNAIALNNLAWLYFKAGDDRAESVARRAFALAPGSSQVADTLGWILAEKGNTREGLPILEAAAAGAPEDADISYHHAAALAKSGDTAAAVTRLQSILGANEVFTNREEAEGLLRKLSN